MREEQKVDYGSIQIHKKVLSDIVLSVIQETEGVVLAPQSISSYFSKIFGRKNYSGITVMIDKDNEVSMEVRICIRFGMNIPEASRQLQDVIRESVEKTTDIHLKDIHINIQGIEGGT